MSTRPRSPTDIAASLQRVARALDDEFLGKSETIRLMLIAAVAGEHMLLVGPPGTAKSALVRSFSRHCDARYFEYLLTRFTEPNEIFGPIDIQAFREGSYKRRMEGMLPDAEIVFLDEIFKANSAILNSLLGVLNERTYTSGAQVTRVPLISAFGASNEVPSDEELLAVFDRFLLRVRSENLEGFHFQDLLVRGVRIEQARIAAASGAARSTALLSSDDLRALQSALSERLDLGDDFLAQYKGLVFQIRNEGISLSDRRAIKMLKLFAASALVDGRARADASDFFLLRHAWNTIEQAELLDAIVGPVLEEHHRAHPESRRVGAIQVGVDALIAELNRIRDLLTSGAALSDVQLFSHLRALNELKTALLSIGTEPARQAAGRVDQLLGHVFQSGKFS